MNDRLIDDLTMGLDEPDHRRGLLKTAVAGTLAVVGFGAVADTVLGKKCKNNKDCPDDKQCKHKNKNKGNKNKGRCK